MIEVNLVPGATKRPVRRGARAGRSLPKLGRLPQFDRVLAFVIAAWIIGPAVVGWMFFGPRSEKAALELTLDQARQDSAHYATMILANRRLQARRDTIAQKLQIIQQIDADRYVWSHILSEVNRALPAYTWLTALYATEGDSTSRRPTFRIEGRTGNTFALTEFMKDLEASPFIHGVTLTSTELVKEGGKLLHAFALNARYEAPPPDAIQTVPLFTQEQ